MTRICSERSGGCFAAVQNKNENFWFAVVRLHAPYRFVKFA